MTDEAFEHDGQLTKREVRAATLARLGPVPGGLQQRVLPVSEQVPALQVLHWE